ncbi:MAG: NAD(P)-binding protein, partial [Spirochaetota bacterium]|nr:NAD(P)-binding protein [Spirochaetota bacterium]
FNAVEHAIGEYGLQNNLSFEKPTIKTSKHIAVIGGGPAGLSAAYQLARKGHKVTIYEAQDKLGGMIRYGIMRYRVNREVLEKEINRILDLGIEVKTNFRIGKDISLDELKKKHDAVFIGVGAQKGRNIPIPGFDGANQTINSIDFLMEFEKKGESMQIGKQVLVIGDGNVAMDVARLALRLGSQAAVVSGVPKNEMACFPEEFDDAVNEGTNFHLQIGSIEVIRNGNKVKSLKCTKMQKKEKGEEGWNSSIPFLRYKPIIGTEFVIECDMIVSAIGQSTDMAGLESIANNANWLQVDSNYKVKGMDGVFGGGDAIKIDLITTAIGHGNKAAKAIDDYINSKTPPPSEYQDIIPYEKLHPNSFLPSSKVKRKHLKIDSIIGNYSETIKSLDQDSVIKEAGRCMSCGLCFECNQCLLFCPQGAISKFKFNPIGEVMFTDYNMCIGCHLCADICPTGYIRMGMGEDL